MKSVMNLMMTNNISLMIFVLLLVHGRVTDGQTFSEYIYNYMHTYVCICVNIMLAICYGCL